MWLRGRRGARNQRDLRRVVAFSESGVRGISVTCVGCVGLLIEAADEFLQGGCLDTPFTLTWQLDAPQLSVAEEFQHLTRRDRQDVGDISRCEKPWALRTHGHIVARQLWIRLRWLFRCGQMVPLWHQHL